MKKAIVLLWAFSLLGFNSKNEGTMTLKATKILPLTANQCTVALELHNGFERKVSFLSMSCSDEGFYVTDNPNVVVIPKPCDKNIPKSILIAQNSYRTAKLDLEMLKNTKSAKFRIGFRFIEIPKNVKLGEFDSTKVKGITVWSNAIEYKSH